MKNSRLLIQLFSVFVLNLLSTILIALGFVFLVTPADSSFQSFVLIVLLCLMANVGLLVFNAMKLLAWNWKLLFLVVEILLIMVLFGPNNLSESSVLILLSLFNSIFLMVVVRNSRQEK